MVIAIEPLRVAYMAIPKAACTSVKAALAAVDPAVAQGNEIFGADPMELHRIYPTRRFRRYRWIEYHGWFRFTVVRDPVKRLMSVYTDLVASRNLLKNSRKFQRGLAPVTDEPEPDFFFQHLKTYTEFASVMNHHTLPQLVFTGTQLRRYTRVYRTSEMADLAVDLSTAARREVTIPRLNKSKARLDFEDLAPRTQEMLRVRGAPDYAHLKDYFEPPW